MKYGSSENKQKQQARTLANKIQEWPYTSRYYPVTNMIKKAYIFPILTHVIIAKSNEYIVQF